MFSNTSLLPLDDLRRSAYWHRVGDVTAKMKSHRQLLQLHAVVSCMGVVASTFGCSVWSSLPNRGFSARFIGRGGAFLRALLHGCARLCLERLDEAVKLDPKNARIYGNEPGQNIHLPLPNKKQASLEMVGFSCQCSVLVRSGLDS